MIQECLASFIPKHWSDCIDHVKQVEKVYWASDIARDEMLKPVVESDEETDTADEFEDDMSSYTSTCIVQKWNKLNRMIENATNKKIQKKYKKYSIPQF